MAIVTNNFTGEQYNTAGDIALDLLSTIQAVVVEAAKLPPLSTDISTSTTGSGGYSFSVPSSFVEYSNVDGGDNNVSSAELDNITKDELTKLLLDDDTAKNASLIVTNGILVNDADRVKLGAGGELANAEGAPELSLVLDDGVITVDELANLSPQALTLLSSLRNSQGVDVYGQQIAFAVSRADAPTQMHLYENAGEATGLLLNQYKAALDEYSVAFANGATPDELKAITDKIDLLGGQIESLSSDIAVATLGTSVSTVSPADRADIQQSFVAGVLSTMTDSEKNHAADVLGKSEKDLGFNDLPQLYVTTLSTDDGAALDTNTTWFRDASVVDLGASVTGVIDSLSLGVGAVNTIVTWDAASTDDITEDRSVVSFSGVVGEGKLNASNVMLTTFAPDGVTPTQWGTTFSSALSKNTQEFRQMSENALEFLRTLTSIMQTMANS